MRIVFQKHAIEGRLPILDDAYRRHVELASEFGVELVIRTLPTEVYGSSLPEQMVRFGAIEEVFANYFARSAYQAGLDGFDVFLIGTSQDPGLAQARAMASIPCLGYGETSLRMAQVLTQRIGIVGFIPELASPIETNFHRYGLGESRLFFEYIPDGVGSVQEALSGDPSTFLTLYSEAVERVAARGAELVIPGEGLPNEILAMAGITELSGLPILDSNALLVRSSISLAGMMQAGEVTRPQLGYWNRRPSPGAIQHLIAVTSM